jgi:hypothetical protein
MAGNLVVGPNVNITKDGLGEAEQAIAINPTNPLNLFAMATVTSIDPNGVMSAYSFDGGQTWTTKVIATGSDGLKPACCDESAAFDKFGNLFISYLDAADTNFSPPLPSVVAVSTDGGKTFKELADFPSNDQPKIAIGPGGSTAASSVWIEYQDPNGNIDAVGAPVTGLGQVGSFIAPIVATDSTGGNFGKLSIGPQGQVAVSYENPSGGSGPANLFAALDPNGLAGTSFNPSTVISATNVGGFTTVPPQPQRQIDSEVGLAYDYTGGPHNGRLYAVYTDSPAVNSPASTIYERFSDDNGSTWSPRIQVSDSTSNLSEFNPRIAVDPATGNVGVSWLDTRNGGGTQYEAFATVSTDGGQTFLPNVQVAANLSNAITANGGDNGGFDTGDYSGMAFYNNVMYPVWSDNSSLSSTPGNFDLATASVTLVGLSAKPVNFAGSEGQPFSGTVATFTDNASGVTASDFTASIDWGDGNTSVGTITQQPNGSFVVTGTNTYTEGGTYTATVTITGPGSTSATAIDTATITDAPLTIGPLIPAAIAEGQATPILLAKFTDADPNPTFASSYNATITFDDGSTVAGTVTADPNVAGQFDVSTTHPLEEGDHPISLVVTDSGGATASLSESLAVLDAPLTPLGSGTTVTGTAGQPFSTILGSFTDAYTQSFPEDFTALVNWDGTNSTYVNVIQGQAPGTYKLVGGFAYPSFGTYTYTINVTDVGGAQTTIQGTANIADATLQAGVPVTIQAVEGVASQSTVLADFSSSNPVATAGQFQATVAWGDGTTTTGSVIGSAASGFQVIGAHGYAEEGNYQVTVAIQSMPGGAGSKGGSTLTINGSAAVADAPLTLNVATPQPTEQAAFTSAVGTFSDANVAAPIGDYSATVSWGDGTTSPGTIRPNGDGTYTILASHTYAQDLSYPLSVTVSDVGGSHASATTTVTPATLIVPVTGTINPASVTSVVPGAPITRVVTPAFLGHSAPGSTIQLFVISGGMTVPELIGTATADANGNWAVTSRPLVDGPYSVIAASADAAQKPNSPLVSLLPSPLIVDTATPRVLGATLSPATGQLSVTYFDTGSGIDIFDIVNPAAYSLTRSGGRRVAAGGVTLTPMSLAPAGLAGAFTVTFAVGAVPQGSTYNLTIHSAAVTDWAGNPLDGAFTLNFPTGNGVPGSVFQGQFAVFGTAPIQAQPPFAPVDLLGAQVHENLVRSRTVGRRRR